MGEGLPRGLAVTGKMIVSIRPKKYASCRQAVHEGTPRKFAREGLGEKIPK